MEWKPIDSAPKEVVSRGDNGRSLYGPRILLYPYFGNAVTGKWWQSVDCDKPGWERYQTFLEDGGNAFSPTHWMPLPEPPK